MANVGLYDADAEAHKALTADRFYLSAEYDRLEALWDSRDCEADEEEEEDEE
jgi:hypothetical protein